MHGEAGEVAAELRAEANELNLLEFRRAPVSHPSGLPGASPGSGQRACLTALGPATRSGALISRTERPGTLFRRLLLALGEREALRFFTACRAFLNVVSTLAVSHKASTLTLPPPVPSCFAASR